MDVIALETPSSTIKFFAPETEDITPFFIPEYGSTLLDTPCYQLRLNSAVGCLQYVQKGSGVLITDDNIYTVSTGDTFLLQEGTNQIYYSNADNQFARIWINFKGDFAKRLLELYGIEDTVVFRQTDTLSLLERIQEVCKTAKTPQEYKDASARVFLEIIQFLAQHKTESVQVNSPLEQIRLYIERHITENIKLAEISKDMYLSQEHIIRSFRQKYGVTPHKYILQSKIRIAMIMLHATDYSIEEISSRLSFSDPHHFSAQFQKHTGYRPSAYRKKFR